MMKIVISFILTVILSCSNHIAGTTDETNTGIKAMVKGILFEPDGKNPAKGATVVMRKKNFLADINSPNGVRLPFQSASVTTDRNGFYSIDTIDTGLYIIDGNDGRNNVIFIDSINIVSPDSMINLPADTLRPAGVIKGKIMLTEGGDPRKVSVLAFDFDRFALPDSNGTFVFPRFAQGHYTLRFLPALENYGVLDSTGISVKSGDTTNLGTIIIPFKSIRSPKQLKIALDTLNQIVSLNWEKSDTSLIRGYTVYRSESGQNFERITKMPLPKTSTVFYDSNVVIGKVYEYHVVTLDVSGNESPMAGTGDTVKIVSPSLVSTTFRWTIKNTLSDSASINDTVCFILHYENPTRKIAEINWLVDGNDSIIRRTSSSTFSGDDSIALSWNSPGKKRIFIRATDNAGTIWKDSQSVTILQDKPKVNLHGDTIAAINTPVTFSVTTSQLFGTIKKYLWKSGFMDSFQVTQDSLFTVKYRKEGDNTISVIAVDDDGNADTVSRNITITNEAPIVLGLSDTTISINDTIRFAVTAHDTNGILQRYFWNFGDNSANQFDTTGEPYILHVFPSQAMQCRVRVAVADSFGKLGTGEALVTVVQDKPVIRIAPDTMVFTGDTIRLYGAATQKFGKIVEYAWDVGNTGTFIKTSKADTTILAPNNAKLNWICALRVIDDDGNVSKASMNIWVKQFPAPVVNAGPDTAVHRNNPITLHGKATQQIGSIVKWEWNINNNGFITTPSGDITIPPQDSSFNSISCILRVTNDRGVSGVDTLVLTIGYWEALGAKGFSDGGASQLSLVVDNGVPYLAYADFANAGRATVVSFNGTTWESVGPKGFSAGYGYTYYHSLAVSHGVVYLAFCDTSSTNSKPTVARFNGGTWELLGAPAGAVKYLSLDVAGNIPYVVFSDTTAGKKATVMRYSGNVWETVGTRGFSEGIAAYPTLAFDDTVPYVAFCDSGYGCKTTVMRYTENSWNIVGTRGISGNSTVFQSLVVDRGIPYVAFNDGGYYGKIMIMRYNGNSWVPFEVNGLENAPVLRQTLAVSNGTAFVAVQNGYLIVDVFALSGAGLKTVGTKVSDGGAANTSIATYNGAIFVAYQDFANGGRATVLKYW